LFKDKQGRWQHLQDIYTNLNELTRQQLPAGDLASLTPYWTQLNDLIEEFDPSTACDETCVHSLVEELQVRLSDHGPMPICANPSHRKILRVPYEPVKAEVEQELKNIERELKLLQDTTGLSKVVIANMVGRFLRLFKQVDHPAEGTAYWRAQEHGEDCRAEARREFDENVEEWKTCVKNNSNRDCRRMTHRKKEKQTKQKVRNACETFESRDGEWDYTMTRNEKNGLITQLHNQNNIIEKQIDRFIDVHVYCEDPDSEHEADPEDDTAKSSSEDDDYSDSEEDDDSDSENDDYPDSENDDGYDSEQDENTYLDDGSVFGDDGPVSGSSERRARPSKPFLSDKYVVDSKSELASASKSEYDEEVVRYDAALLGKLDRPRLQAMFGAFLTAINDETAIEEWEVEQLVENLMEELCDYNALHDEDILRMSMEDELRPLIREMKLEWNPRVRNMAFEKLFTDFQDIMHETVRDSC